MASSPGPWYVNIKYHSSFGPHSMTIPTLTWNDVASENPNGQFDTWDPGGVDAQNMVEQLVTALLEFFGANVQFDNWIVYYKPDPVGVSQPKTGNNFTSFTGTDGSPGWEEAVQMTFNGRTADFGASKVVLLDAGSNGDFSKVSAIPGSGRIYDVEQILISDNNGWRGRDNAQITSLISVTITLNEKLRRAYRLT